MQLQAVSTALQLGLFAYSSSVTAFLGPHHGWWGGQLTGPGGLLKYSWLAGLCCAGAKSAVKLGNALEPIRVGTKFETQRDMLGLKLAMT
jgi:hypothetical protein